MFYDVGFDCHHPRKPDGEAIGVATSKDGVTWTDSPRSPVLTSSERTPDLKNGEEVLLYTGDTLPMPILTVAYRDA